MIWIKWSLMLVLYLESISITDSAQYREIIGSPDISGISLAIVFDSTGSMGNDLKQVKLGSRRILKNHLQKGYKNFIKDFVLVQVHDPDVGPAKKTTSPKTFNRYLDSVYTQGGGDCPEMTITGIEMALEAARPNSLIYVFTDSSAKDHALTPRVLNLIQKKQSQVVFVLTGFCNSTEEIGFQVYKQIATISSGQIYILGKGDVKEFMKIIEKAVESLKVHILQEDSTNPGSKTYSFPIDSHVRQFTIQVTNFKANESTKVTVRDPEGRELTESNGLVRLMKKVSTVYFASKENPSPGIWTLEVSTKSSTHSVRITGTSEVDFLPGFSTFPEPFNDRTSRQPIKGVKNYLMANVTGNYQPGTIDLLNIVTVNGSSVIRLPVNQTENTQIYMSRYPFEIPIDGHFYIKITGKDSRGYELQRYSRIAIISRDPQPVSVSCPAKLQIKRGYGVNVTCLVQSEIPYLINWYKNDVKVVGTETDNIQFKQTSNVTFKIERANEVSQGVYACEMVPIIPKQLILKGDMRDQVIVTVLPPPPKVLVPKNASIEPLKDAELECNVFSTSSNVILKWYKDVPRFELKNTKRFRIEQYKKSTNAFSSKLIILSASESDNGKYICMAEHEGGKNEAAGFIKIHTLPSVSAEETEISFVENDSISAICRAVASPPPTFSWHLNGREINVNDPRVSITSDGIESQIKINNIKPQDAGDLICKAKNTAGEDEIRIKITYISPPKILTLDIAKEIAIEREPQSVRCIAQGVPSPKITWEYNGSPVTMDGNIMINETVGTLDINRVEKNMKGQWNCVATNMAGSVRKPFMLEIGFAPKIKEFVSNIDATYGENVTIKCAVDAQPPPRVKWFKSIPGGDTIPIALGDRYFINQDNSLIIRGLLMEDQTVYICEAQNQHGKTQESVQIRISGIVAPKIAFTQSKQVVVESTLKKVIVCMVVESKPPAVISWLKNSKEIEYSSRVVAKHNTLIIKNVKSEDEGIYTCIAKNQVGTAKFDIEVDVQSKPLISGDMKTFIETSEGKKLVLQCQTKGDPKPKIEWRKGGRPLTMEPGSTYIFSPDGSELTIYSAAEEHAGTFTCTATNDHAAVVKEFKVTVKIPPIISKEGISDYEIASKDNVELNCVVISGNPSPKIEWFKNGQPIVEIPGRVEIAGQKNILKIYGNNEEETGSFECRATNEVDTDSKFYQITVLVPPKPSESKLIKVYTREGEKIVLPCKIEGFPVPTKTWSWKSTIIDLQRNPFGITFTPNDKTDLLITQMKSELQGVYVCEGVNTGGSAKMTYDVIILESPKIVQFKESSAFFVGNTITLTCIASGNPSPKIKWLFLGKLLPPNAPGYRMVGNSQETLIVERAAPMHGGKYSCLAENEGGRDQKDSIVTVFVPPDQQAKNIINNRTITPTLEGGNITFTCVMNSTPPAEIKWFKNDLDLYVALPKNRFHISLDGSTLTLFDVKPQDEGRYKCLAVNIPGQWSLNFTLQVLISPVILAKLSSKSLINVNEETDLFINCWSEGNPTPTYSWYKDNSQLISGGRIEITNGGKTLQIKKVRRSDNATYQCRVKNEAGEDKRNFDVNVFLPPTISGVLMRETPEFLQGSTTSLWCNVSGFPMPQIKWTYLETGNPPILLSNNSQLHFINIDRTHITRYTCIATNEAGTARKLFDPVLTFPPKINPVDTDKKRWILKSGEMRLSCNSEAAPQPNTEWFKDGELIKNNPRINITNKGTQLHLFGAQETDIGIYKCLVSNKFGMDKQVWTVDIMIPPSIRFSSLPGIHQVALGGALYLFCVSEGRPKPKIEWNKDGTRIDLRRVILSEDGYHLTVNSTIETDVGRYQCVAENTHGQTDRSFDVQVTYGPTLDTGGKRYYKIERTVGGATLLECLVSGNPTPSISWLKDGIPINRLPSYRYRIIGNKQLEIIAMQASDAGRYSCVAKNTFGQMEIFMDVTVGAPPTIDRNRILNEYIVKVGDELRLPCPATGSPTPVVAFHKDGTNLDSIDLNSNVDASIKKRLSVSQERQMLTLFYAKRTDSGLYQCNASNAIGYDVMEYRVRVRSPPEFDTSNVQPEVYWFTNQTRSLECTLVGVADPPAKISWERHGVTLSSGANIRISPDGTKLTVENVKQYDAGEYKCHAQNDVSKISLIFQVLVYVKPRFHNSQLYTVIDAVQNKTIQLSCECVGHPTPILTWYRQEREITPGLETSYNTVIIRGNAVLQISSIQASDADVYSCTANNGGGTIEKKFQVNVILPPRIIKRSNSPEIHRGKESVQITLHCNVYNYNATKPVILWSKENSPILSGDTDYYLTDNNGQSLTILNPKSDESGLYTCDAENIAGRDSYSFQLSITSPPKFPPDFLTLKETLTIPFGSSVNFQCPAEGSPPPTITWYHKDIPIPPFDMVNYVISNNAKVLTIPSVTKEEGIFKCIARNDAGSIAKSYKLDISMPALVRLDKVEIRERSGTTFSVHCTAEGYPKPVIQWTREGKGIFRLGTKTDIRTGMLEITDAREDDSGKYTCTGTNRNSQDSKSVDVFIISPPKIETPKKPIMVRIGEQVLLHCVVEGTPPFRIHWYTPNNNQISANILREYRLLPEGLIIDNVRKDHAGVYRCVASNDAGYQEIRVTLEVLVPPKIFRPAEMDITGILNSVLQMQCKILEGNPTPIIYWERNGVPLTKSQSYYSITESGHFIFHTLKNEDEGSLTCVAKNAAGEDRITFQINVELLPKVTLPVSVTGDEGGSVTITCRVEGKPKPSVVWKKESQSLTNVLGTRFRYNSDNEIYIYELKPEDAGNYNCIGERSGAESSTSSTYLSVFTRPKFVFKPKPKIIVQEGRWKSFNCEATSHPKPDIKWMFNGRLINSRSNSNGRGSLIIKSVGPENGGEYTCIAKNRVGTIEYRYLLEVIAKPKVRVYQSDEPTSNLKRTILMCKVEGKADLIIWLKNGIVVQNSSRMYISNSNLIIDHTESSDTGNYQCIASNSAGEAQGQVNLLVKSPPIFTLIPGNTTATLGDVLILHCAAEGYPVPAISWYKDKNKVEFDFVQSIIKNGSLRIIGVQKEHAGIYFCVASNNQGEVHSAAAHVSIQIAGGWSRWHEWSKCSVSCGKGFMERNRLCNNPPPSNDGMTCIGEKVEKRGCLLRFCPTDGQWSLWEDWSVCSTSCGSGIRQRARRCDNPPPSNLGKPCIGEPIEDIFCEGNLPCPINGGWSVWQPWSVCSVSCGSGGSQRRERNCNNPAPKTGGQYCPGKDLEIRSCSKGPCPINGQWGAWSKWSYCSKSCGSGFKQKTRRCDKPLPQFGGSNCIGSNIKKTKCNESPCPVHGQWSNWGSWSECSTLCGGGLQERDRTCNQPKPSFGGQWCRGPSKDVQRCNEGNCNIKSNLWSNWSSWSVCSTTCFESSTDISKRTRSRKCLSTNKICSDESVETMNCNWLPKCTSQKSNYRSLGEIRGTLNGEDIGLVLLNASWNSNNVKKTYFNISLTGIQQKYLSCFKVFTGLLTPLLWFEAFEVGLAGNGKTTSKGNFQMQTSVEFSDGQSIQLNHIFVTKDGQVKLLTTILGQCPSTILNSNPMSISLENYKEVIVQMNPALGKLNSDSSRHIRINKEIEPYQWSTNITVDKGGRQPVMIQQLLIQDLVATTNSVDGKLDIIVSSLVAEDDDSKSCPAGFNLIKGQRYCEDTNECAELKLNKCDQICENTVPRFKCNCRSGFMLNSDGKSCQDIDECSLQTDNDAAPICPEHGHECINTVGSFFCRPKCSPGLRRSADKLSCEDINECVEKPSICGIQQCINTFSSFYCLCRQGYRKVGNQCVDVDECIIGLANCNLNQKCRNTPGSFHCENVCSYGYQLINEQCQDIDECVIGIAKCSSGATCTNLPGSFRCDCDSGFYSLAGSCVDLDECKTNVSKCKYGCKNTFGSYECQCPSNLLQSSDKKSCLSKHETCKPGFTWDVHRGCIDVNECEAEKSVNSCQYRCINTYGSYRCVCPAGYNLNPRNMKCIDIDECRLNSNGCPNNLICINMPGNYSCLEPKCPSGYQFDIRLKACVSNCTGKSKQCLSQASRIQYVVIQMTGSMAQPVEVRVINTMKEKENNCQYMEKDVSPNIPITYESLQGSIILKPSWRDFNESIYQKQPYFLLFDVACWSTPEKHYQIFQKSFYIYITLSKYPF